jgi:hypothetical protein
MYYPKAYEPAPSKDNATVSINNTIIIFIVFMSSIVFLSCIPTFCKIKDRRHEVILLQARARVPLVPPMPPIELIPTMDIIENNEERVEQIIIIESPDNDICIGKV